MKRKTNKDKTKENEYKIEQSKTAAKVEKGWRQAERMQHVQNVIEVQPTHRHNKKECLPDDRRTAQP